MDSLPAEPQGKPKNTGVGSLSLLQQIIPNQESNQGLLHCRWFFTNWAIKAAAAAKSRQSCLTLCDPIDGSPPSSHPSTKQYTQPHWELSVFPYLKRAPLLFIWSSGEHFILSRDSDDSQMLQIPISWYQKTYPLSSSVQLLSCVWLLATPWTIAHRPHCPSPTPRTCSNACSSSRWRHPTISSSIVPFSSCLQSFLASGSILVSQFFTSGCRSIGASASASALPINIQDWFPLGLTGLIFLQSKGLKSLLQNHSWKASVLWHSAFFMVQLSQPYMTTGKTIPLTIWTFVGKEMSQLFNMLSRLVITFLPRSKRLLISWLQSPSTVILEPKKIKSVTVSIVSPSLCHEVMKLDAMILVFWMLSFKPTFSVSSFTSSRGSLVLRFVP